MSTKILFLTAYDMNKNGGVQNQINLMKKTLIDLEYEVKICSSNSNDFNIGKSIKLPFNSSIASVTLFPDKKILQKAIDWADIIHIQEPFIPLFFWRYTSNKKTVVTHHASLNKIYLLIQEILFLFTKQDVISTCVSKNSLLNAYTLSSKVILIPNSININTRASFKNNNSIVFVGRNEIRKNLKLFEKLSNNKMLNGLYEFIAITNKKGKSKFIKYYINPNDEEKLKILNNTSYFLALNKKSESFGLTLIESVNEGNLLIASNLSSFEEVMEDTAVYFKNNNYKSLENAVNYCLNNNMKTQWLKQYNHIKKYDIQNNIKKWISIYTNS